jgi:hypothetical protein
MVTGPVSLEEAVDLLREALPYLPACISTEEEIEDFLLRYDATPQEAPSDGLRCRYCALPVGGPTAAEGGLVERCYGHSHVTAINYVEAP